VRGFVTEWETIAAQTRAGHLRAQLSYARALLAGEATAAQRFTAALAETHGWPSYRARTQLTYGTWLRRRRHNTESRAPLREAADAFTALGSTRFADRAQRELRASGETVRQRRPEVWDQLTPARAPDRATGSRRPNEPRDRRAALYLTPDSRIPSVPALPQARRDFPHRTPCGTGAHRSPTGT
jgi:hypothetical protein